MKIYIKKIVDSVRFKEHIVVTDAEVKASFDKVRERIDGVDSFTLPTVRKIHLFNRTQFRIAASVAILFTLGILALTYYTGQNQNVYVENSSNDIKELVLPDGSEIALRGGSSVKYNKNFAKRRNISLEGEALFSVKKDEKHPFNVETANGSIQVLGTVFSVRAFPNEHYTKALLKEGSVRFTNKENKSVLLKPGQEAQTSETDNKIHVRNIKDIDRALSWKTRTFVFEDESIEEILYAIADAYNMELHFNDDNLKMKKYTLKFNHGEDLSTMLDVLSDIAPIKYNMDNDRLTVQKK